MTDVLPYALVIGGIVCVGAWLWLRLGTVDPAQAQPVVDDTWTKEHAAWSYLAARHKRSATLTDIRHTLLEDMLPWPDGDE